ncbi:hypothetical protein [Flavobacterium sp. UMI-01]|uniref:hypothetical protein n=1 Tax=Flavobacterium sp. UMI-01 TaxID=1441053 RepID=UPI001C7DD9D1|nr:hypothetical protein [Flavobacterium sp. UMI-01]GIZ10002.1 hypothetical protein FUMI01_27280 [Flavobacterium sp. UMI-01]
MILPFSTQLNGKPTYFVEKIWKSLKPIDLSEVIAEIDMKYLAPSYKHNELKPKLHTIRLDENDLWEAGTIIDFFINCRQPNMFRFAPQIPVVSVQEIFMTRRGSMLEISIAKVDSYIGDDDFQLDAFQQGDLALNDGFEDYNDFRNYFLDIIEKKGKETGNYWFKGKIIHWTDLKY